ncbi:MAG: hypothetical protein JXO51_11005 [Candidatus Aminicenantes bacterium]|nr:hypothetical protein [Candidatus Aminicenantes bacterium]
MGAQDWHFDMEANSSGNFVNIRHTTCGAVTRFNLDSAVAGSTHRCVCGAGVLLSAESLSMLKQALAQAKKFAKK